MMQVSIIIPRACSLESSIVRLCRLFDAANAGSSDALFNVSLAGADSHITLYGNQLSVQPHYTLTDNSVHDIVIIPALAGNVADALFNNRELIPWLVNQYRQGAVIAGCCTGAFLLSDEQLVNDDHCNKTWYVAADFRKEFAQVNDVAEKLVPDKKSIATENGAYTFINRLLQQMAGADIAASCAAQFEAEFNRECQSVFSISHKDPPPKSTQQQSLPAGSYADRFYSTGNGYTGNAASTISNAVTMKRVLKITNIK